MSDAEERTDKNKATDMGFLRAVIDYGRTNWLHGTDSFLRCCSYLSGVLIYGARGFITLFSRARHLFMSCARWTQSTWSCPISLRSLLIVSYHLGHGLPNGLFPSDLPTQTLFVCLFLPVFRITNTNTVKKNPIKINKWEYLKRNAYDVSPTAALST
jgi:hypothetical protein